MRKFNKERLFRAVLKTKNVNLATLYIIEFGTDRFGLDEVGRFIINNIREDLK